MTIYYINVHTGIRGRKGLTLAFRFFVFTAAVCWTGLSDRKYCLMVGNFCLGFLYSSGMYLKVVLMDPSCDRALKRFAPRCVLFWALMPEQILLVIVLNIFQTRYALYYQQQ